MITKPLLGSSVPFPFPFPFISGVRLSLREAPPFIMGDEVTIEDVFELEAAGPMGNFNDIGVNFEAVAFELMLPDPLNPE